MVVRPDLIDLLLLGLGGKKIDPGGWQKNFFFYGVHSATSLRSKLQGRSIQLNLSVWNFSASFQLDLSVSEPQKDLHSELEIGVELFPV